MKNVTRFLVTLTATAAVMASAQSVGAQQYGTGQYGQYGQYGQQPTQPGQRILIDKKVATPGSATGKAGEGAGVYVDNLLQTDARFSPGDQIVFKIIVKNTTNQTLRNVVVRDIIPTYVEPIVGPGNYDAGTRTITYTIPELVPNAEDIQYLKMQVLPQHKLPANESLIRQVNTAEARFENQQDTDTAQYFVEKQVTGVTRVPDTGPGLGLAFLALQGAGLAIGLKLRKHQS